MKCVGRRMGHLRCLNMGRGWEPSLPATQPGKWFSVYVAAWRAEALCFHCGKTHNA